VPAVPPEKQETSGDDQGGQPERDDSPKALTLKAHSPAALLANNPKESPGLPGAASGQSGGCDHAGVWLFARVLNQVNAVVEPRPPGLRPGSASLSWRAMNI
jgi:hypothetical protein